MKSASKNDIGEMSRAVDELRSLVVSGNEQINKRLDDFGKEITHIKDTTTLIARQNHDLRQQDIIYVPKILERRLDLQHSDGNKSQEEENATTGQKAIPPGTSRDVPDAVPRPASSLLVSPGDRAGGDGLSRRPSMSATPARHAASVSPPSASSDVRGKEHRSDGTRSSGEPSSPSPTDRQGRHKLSVRSAQAQGQKRDGQDEPEGHQSKKLQQKVTPAKKQKQQPQQQQDHQEPLQVRQATSKDSKGKKKEKDNKGSSHGGIAAATAAAAADRTPKDEKPLSLQMRSTTPAGGSMPKIRAEERKLWRATWNAEGGDEPFEKFILRKRVELIGGDGGVGEATLTQEANERMETDSMTGEPIHRQKPPVARMFSKSSKSQSKLVPSAASKSATTTLGKSADISADKSAGKLTGKPAPTKNTKKDSSSDKTTNTKSSHKKSAVQQDGLKQVGASGKMFGNSRAALFVDDDDGDDDDDYLNDMKDRNYKGIDKNKVDTDVDEDEYEEEDDESGSHYDTSFTMMDMDPRPEMPMSTDSPASQRDVEWMLKRFQARKASG